LIDKSKELYKEGLWTLYGIEEDEGSVLLHLCRDHKSRLRNNETRHNHCLSCGTQAPAKIAGLNHMSNWGKVGVADDNDLLDFAIRRATNHKAQKIQPLYQSLRTKK